MGKINDISKYPIKEIPASDDFILGTDTENFNRTVSFRLSSIEGGGGGGVIQGLQSVLDTGNTAQSANSFGTVSFNLADSGLIVNMVHNNTAGVFYGQSITPTQTSIFQHSDTTSSFSRIGVSSLEKGHAFMRVSKTDTPATTTFSVRNAGLDIFALEVELPRPTLNNNTIMYVPLNFTDGSTTVTASNQGLVDLSSLLSATGFDVTADYTPTGTWQFGGNVTFGGQQVDMADNVLENLGDPVNGQDAVTLSFLENYFSNNDSFVTGHSWNASTGVLTLSRSNLTAITVDLNGRWLTDAPSDGFDYGRNNGAWVRITSGGGSFDTTSNYSVTGTWNFENAVTFENVVDFSGNQVTGVRDPQNATEAVNLRTLENSIDIELPLSSTILSDTDVLLVHADGMNEVTSATNIAVTIQNNATINIPVGKTVVYKQNSTGQIEITFGTGVTGIGDGTKTYRVGDTIVLWQKATDVWEVINPPKALDSSIINEPSGAVQLFNAVEISQADYDAGTPVAGTLYAITS